MSMIDDILADARVLAEKLALNEAGRVATAIAAGETPTAIAREVEVNGTTYVVSVAAKVLEAGSPPATPPPGGLSAPAEVAAPSGGQPEQPPAVSAPPATASSAEPCSDSGCGCQHS